MGCGTSEEEAQVFEFSQVGLAFGFSQEGLAFEFSQVGLAFGSWREEGRAYEIVKVMLA
jgi:hypothetical protein